MAYDSLKALIRQYIKTNGEQEITGQILQNVLVEMVNQYPSTDGYATQSWVTSQGYLIPGSRISLLGNDVGYLTSADLSGYATTSQLAGYLPLTGGTLTGDLNMAGNKLYFGTGTSYINEYTIPGPQGTNMGHILNFNGVDGYGYYNFDNSVHATSFVKANGTSNQFLKADGSVDSNTYITASALTGYATQAWVQQQGYITASALNGYATQAWVNTQLSGYLPLTGGTLTGDLIINSGDASYFRIYGSAGNGYGLISVDGDGLFINASNTSGGNVYLNPDVVVGRSLDVSSNLNVGTNAYIDNECHAASFIQTSDVTKKNILGNVGLSLHDVANAPLFEFAWKDSEDQRHHVGTSAQYWQSVIPEVVSEDKRGVLGLQYDVTALACAITVAKTVVDHEERIKNLESKIFS